MFELYEDILTIEDACGILKMSRNSMYTLLKSGELRGFQQGRVWKIPKQAVIEYVKKKFGLK